VRDNLLPVRHRFVLTLTISLLTYTSAQTVTPEKLEAPQTEYGRYKASIVQANDLAGSIHSEADAKAYLDEIVGLFPQEFSRLQGDTKRLRRLAQAEYESASDRAKLIPEQEVVNIWNEYVREVGGPVDAIASAVEIHDMRDRRFDFAKHAWAAGTATRWNIPNGYAVGPDGELAPGCRALEALLVLHDLSDPFSLKAARQRLSKQGDASKNKNDPSNYRVGIRLGTSPVDRTEQTYNQHHGPQAYHELLARLFDKVFPA
jgi:hypothetical protein